MPEAGGRDVHRVPRARQAATEPLRIAHFALGRTNPEAADGIDKTVYHLSRTQAALGHTVRLFSITNKPALPIPGVEVSAYPSIVPPRILVNPRLRDVLIWRSPFNLPRRLISDLFAWRPDLVHLHGVHILQHLRLAHQARRRRTPYCVTVHGMLSRRAEARRPGLKRAVATFQRPFLNRAAFVHALTESEEGELRSYGVTAPIVVATNGIDPQGLLPPRAAVADSSVDFLFLGRLDPEQKGLDLLVEGFARSGLARAQLSFVGPDWRGGRSTLEALAGRLGVANRVRFLGPATGPRKTELLAQAAVFVHPSRWEGVAFSVLEAAGMGRPLLLTRAADPRGEFERAAAAIVVAPDPVSIAGGLQSFARMLPAERLDMGMRARKVVETEFTWPAAAQQLLQAYRQSQPVRQP